MDHLLLKPENPAKTEPIADVERLDHVPCVIQELVFILILERIINCYSSNYISLWRTLLIEFYRNPNHSLNIKEY